MVNVPGRSKVCHTCRRRRIACDQQRPSCSRCLRANLDCEGYHREWIFKADPAATKQKGKAAVEPLATKDACSRQLVASNCHAIVPTTRPSHFQHRLPLSKTPSPLSTTLLPHAAYRAAFFAYLVAFDTSSTPGSAHATQTNTHSWIAPIHTLASVPPALHSSALALCVVQAGRLNSDSNLMSESLGLYVQGLRALHYALKDPEQVLADETLAACLCLALYEAMECPDGKPEGYTNHREGCAQLLRLRGVQRCRREWGRALWNVVRFQSILGSFETKQKSFVMEQPWVGLFFVDSQMTPQDRVIYLLGTVPDFLREADLLPGLEPKVRLDRMKDLSRRLWSYDLELYECQKELEGENIEPLFKYIPLRIQEEGPDELLSAENPPGNAEFQSPPVAETLVLLWTIQVILWSGMETLYQLLPTAAIEAGCFDFSMDGYPPLDHRQDWISVVRKINQSVKYFMREELLGLQPPRVAFPLGVMLSTLQNRPQYRQDLLHVKDARERISESKMKFLKVAKHPFYQRR